MNTGFSPSEYKNITVQQARQMMCSLSRYIVIIDVRRPDEYRSGHIKNAVNIPLGELLEKAPALLPDISQEIIVYCRSGARSFNAAEELLSLGYKNVYDLGGISKWCYGLVTD